MYYDSGVTDLNERWGTSPSGFPVDEIDPAHASRRPAPGLPSSAPNMILPMPSCLRTACPPDIMDNSLKSYTSSSIKCMTQHQFIPHLFLDVPGCCETLLDSNRSAHCRKLAKSTNCEIASNCDPSQGRSISLITRVNPFPGWGHAWTRKMTPSIPIFRNEINALAGRWRDRHVVGVYQCVWVSVRLS